MLRVCRNNYFGSLLLIFIDSVGYVLPFRILFGGLWVVLLIVWWNSAPSSSVLCWGLSLDRLVPLLSFELQQSVLVYFS